jgi:cytoskeletal protein RodZ
MNWPFRHKETLGMEDLPAEVQEFYQEDHKDRTSVAWVLAILSLLVTVSLALGLFFGGRLIYRHATKKKTETVAVNKAANVTKNASTSSNSNKTSTTAGKVDEKAATTTTPSAATTPTPVVTSPAAPITPQAPVAKPTPAPGPAAPTPAATPPTPVPASNPTPAPVVATAAITNTGPGDTMALFLGVSVIAGLIHSIYTRRRVSNF